MWIFVNFEIVTIDVQNKREKVNGRTDFFSFFIVDFNQSDFERRYLKVWNKLSHIFRISRCRLCWKQNWGSCGPMLDPFSAEDKVRKVQF